MDKIMSDALDRYITGNYGEDQFDDSCIECGEKAEFEDEKGYNYCIRCAMIEMGEMIDSDFLFWERYKT